MERGQYQARVVGELRWLLLDPDGRPKPLGREGSARRVVVVVLYRDLERPECVLGWRMEAVGIEDEPDIWTTIVWANFQEHVIGTPYSLLAECSEEGINWTD